MRPPLTSPEFQRWTMSDGYTLQGRVWPPTRPDPAYAALYLHGIQSHGGWFEWSASLLATRGCPVILPDRRGSGLNEAARGDTPSAERWLQDIDEVAAWARRQFGVARFDVVGVSWGGKPAVAWGLRHGEGVARLLLIGPGLFPVVDVGTRTRLQIALSLLTGGKRTIAIPLDNPELFTDNPDGQDFIARDPLRLTRATARFFWHSRRLDRRLLRAGAGTLRATTTLILAGKDRIIWNEPTEGWIRHVAGRDAHVVTIPDAAHTLEFATDRERFRELIEGWGSDELQVAERKRLATEGC